MPTRGQMPIRYFTRPGVFTPKGWLFVSPISYNRYRRQQTMLLNGIGVNFS